MKNSSDRLAILSPFIGILGFCFSMAVYLINPGSLPSLNLLVPLIIFLCFSVSAIITGIISRIRIRKNVRKLRGAGIATAGIIIGSLELGFIAFVYLLFSGRLGTIY